MPVIKYIDPTNFSLTSTPTYREDNATTQTGMQLAKIIRSIAYFNVVFCLQD